MNSTARISVKVDEEVKQGALRVFSELGMDMTTAINLFLRAVKREECIPFDIRTERSHREAIHHEYIKVELEKSIIEANDPNTAWISHNEMMSRILERREAREYNV